VRVLGLHLDHARRARRGEVARRRLGRRDDHGLGDLARDGGRRDGRDGLEGIGRQATAWESLHPESEARRSDIDYVTRMPRWWSAVLGLACCQSEPKPPPPPTQDLARVAVVADAAAPLVDLLHVAGAKVAVSSTVANAKYQPKDLFDGNLSTAWNSRTGDQIGAWIEFRVPAAAHVAKIQLTVGFTATGPEGDYFTMNPRIGAVHVTRLGTHANLGTHVLDPDNRGLQTIDVDSEGGDFEVQITKVVPGTQPRWRELCVSELAVLGTSRDAPGKAPPDVVIGSLDAVVATGSGSGAPSPCDTVDTLQLGAQAIDLVVCTENQTQSLAGSDWVESERHATLVARPGGAVAELGRWTDGWEWGSSWKFDGWLDAPTGQHAVLVEEDSHGPSPGLSGVGATLRAFAVGSTVPWPDLAVADSNEIEIAIDAHHSRAKITKRTSSGDLDGIKADVTTETVHFDGTSVTP
jgi:hypothetical protein